MCQSQSPISLSHLLSPVEVHTFILHICVSISHLQIRLKGLTGRQARGPQVARGNNVEVADFFFPFLLTTSGSA